MLEAKLLISGESVDATGSATFDRHSPASEKPVTKAAAATINDAVHAANMAAAAFPLWSKTGPGERRAVLCRAAEILPSYREQIRETMISEIGASQRWADFNIDIACEILLEAGAMTTSISGAIVPTRDAGAVSMAVRQPVGVCLGIAPWNAPIVLGFRAIAMAIACGNTVVFKASELCPLTHRLIGDVMAEAGLPAGVLNIVSNAPADAEMIVQTLISHPAIRRINFTGSTRVGRQIAEKAAPYLKRCLLELGGKAPMIILEDADLDLAAEAAAFGAFMNQGQICMSTERIILHETIADAFIEKFLVKAKALVAGDTHDRSFPIGPVINEFAAARLRALITDAEAKGAEVLCGGKVRGNFLDATVLDHVTPAMRIYEEETFGPVVSLLRVVSDEEAITLANATEYGLSSAVFSRNIERAMAIAGQLESGICHINSATVADEPQAPFGGMKSSGYGRFGGAAALDEFTELRWISIKNSPSDYSI